MVPSVQTRLIFDMKIVKPIIGTATFIPSVKIFGSPSIDYWVIYAGSLGGPFQTDGAPSLLRHFLEWEMEVGII